MVFLERFAVGQIYCVANLLCGQMVNGHLLQSVSVQKLEKGSDYGRSICFVLASVTPRLFSWSEFFCRLDFPLVSFPLMQLAWMIGPDPYSLGEYDAEPCEQYKTRLALRKRASTECCGFFHFLSCCRRQGLVEFETINNHQGLEDLKYIYAWIQVSNCYNRR